MLENQNPLRSQLENELNNSEWLQKFKAINQLLHSLKAGISEISACDLKWDTTTNGLVIHSPSAEITERIRAQQANVVAIANYADRITLIESNNTISLKK